MGQIYKKSVFQMSFFIILTIQYISYQYVLTRCLFQSVNTSDSTSFKQRRKGEAERSEIEQKHKKQEIAKAGKVTAS